MPLFKNKELVKAIGEAIARKRELNGLNQELNMMHDGAGQVLPAGQGMPEVWMQKIECATAALNASKAALREAFCIDHKELAVYLCSGLQEQKYRPHLFPLPEGGSLFCLVQGEHPDLEDPSTIRLTLVEQGKENPYVGTCLCPQITAFGKPCRLAMYRDDFFRLDLLFGDPQPLSPAVRALYNAYVEKDVLQKEGSIAAGKEKAL